MSKFFDGQQSTVVEVRVAESDAARVIGRGGRTIRALREVSGILASRFNRKVRLELIQED